MKTQLGVFWGDKGLYFVEALADGTPIKTFKVDIPSSTRIGGGAISPPGPMELVSAIQKKCYQQRVDAQQVFFSLPSRDIIFRSFLIPWMQPAEMEEGIRFEAAKYLPFSLEDLVYAYHAITVTEEGIRQLRIVFAAIKKETIKSYVDVFQRASLKVDFIEPAPLSLIRLLFFKQWIQEEEVVALVYKDEEQGKIVIVNQGTPQFVREFSLSGVSGGQEPLSVTRKFVNEIRISLDYFNRQEANLGAQRLVLILKRPEQEVVKALQADLSLGITALDIAKFFASGDIREFGFLKAYGVSLAPYMHSSVDLNLAEKKKQDRPSVGITAGISFKEVDYKKLIATGVVCGLVVLGAFGLAEFFLKKKRQEIDVYQRKLGSYANMSQSVLRMKRKEIEARLNGVRNIRSYSNVAFFLAHLSDFFSQDATVTRMEITYVKPPSEKEGKTTKRRKNRKKKTKNGKVTVFPQRISFPRIYIEGFVYVKNIEKQFQSVHNILRKFQANKNFVKIFKKIELDNVKTTTLRGFPVTFFSILCEVD